MTAREIASLFCLSEKFWLQCEEGKRHLSQSANLPVKLVYEGLVSVEDIAKLHNQIKNQEDVTKTDYANDWKMLYIDPEKDDLDVSTV